MDNFTKSEAKKSFMGGLLGGLLGYALGAYYQNDALAFVLFFAVGYLGYDVRQLFAVSASVLRLMWEIFRGSATEAVSLYREASTHTKVLSPVFPMVAVFLFACANDAFWRVDPSSLEVGVLDYAHANVVWMLTGKNPLGFSQFGVHWSMRLVSFLFAVAIAIVGGLGAWLLVTLAYVHGFYVVKNFREVVAFWEGVFQWLPARMVVEIVYVYQSTLLFLWAFARFLVLAPFQFVTLLVLGIHSYRRVATGLATLAGGGLYLHFLPFASELLSSGMLAVGCGLAAGLTCAGMAIALNGNQREARLRTFLSKPWRPLDWVNEITVKP